MQVDRKYCDIFSWMVKVVIFFTAIEKWRNFPINCSLRLINGENYFEKIEFFSYQQKTDEPILFSKRGETSETVAVLFVLIILNICYMEKSKKQDQPATEKKSIC
jgi:hypothetical protein